jgi:hypothetical protein
VNELDDDGRLVLFMSEIDCVRAAGSKHWQNSRLTSDITTVLCSGWFLKDEGHRNCNVLISGYKIAS